MRRAAFDTSSTGTAILNNAKEEYLEIDTINVVNKSVEIVPGDLVVDLSNTTVRGTVEYVKDATSNLILTDSNGGFTSNSTIEFLRVNDLRDDANNTTTNIHLANLTNSNTVSLGNTDITTVKDIPAHAVVLQLQPMIPTGGSLNFTYKGMSNNYQQSTRSIQLPLDDEIEFSLLEGGSSSRVIASRSNEIDFASPSGARSATVTASMSSTSSGISPVLDLQRRNLFVINNLINNSTALESTNDGQALTRYISKPIELAEGLDAEDLEVYITAYKPPLTEITMYAKLISASDPGLFEEKAWTELELVTDASIVSSSEFDTKEYRYRIKRSSVPTDVYANGTAFDVTTGAYVSDVNPLDTLEDGIVTYEDDNGVVYQRFKTFAVKLVMTTSSPEIVPHVKDIRAIALQK